MKALITAATVAAAALTIAACTVQSTETPAITGPSDLALSIRVEAIPDSIGQDGGSQSSIRIFAFGPNGEPISGLPIRVDMAVDGVVQDFGSLSARTIVTGSDGVARVIYTAPPAPPGGATGTCFGVPGRCVEIIATPSGSNFVTTNSHSVTIRLVPLGVILPPAGTPTATFTFSPSPPTVNLPMTFDASASMPGQGASQITSYVWDFGDGTAASGPVVTKTFTATGTFNVTLTVTNDRGLAASTTLPVDVSVSTAPTAVIDRSPTVIRVGETVFFSGTRSSAAAGRRIVRFDWNFGDGSAASGENTTHQYAAANTYTVTLVVTDDLGQRGTASIAVTVTP